jgi:TPR repeat protein
MNTYGLVSKCQFLYGFSLLLCQNSEIMDQSPIMRLKPRLAFLILVCVCSDLLASDFESAMDALIKGEHREAYRVFKRLAKRDHAKAQYQLGMLYLFGKGVEQDSIQGISWLKEAANNGSYGAANELGQIYVSGKGVAIDEKEGVKWLELATKIAEQNKGEAEDGCE